MKIILLAFKIPSLVCHNTLTTKSEIALPEELSNQVKRISIIFIAIEDICWILEEAMRVPGNCYRV